MRLSSRPHLALIAAAVTVAIAAAPATAVADDAAIKAAVPAALDALAKKQESAAKAIANFNKRKRATQQGRAKVRGVRSSVRAFQTLLRAQQPSTPQGEAAKQALVKSLDLEATAWSRIDLAMKSANHASNERTNRIIARANRTLRKANAAVVKAIRLISAL